MISYAICEISGKQYKVVPDQAFEVDLLGDVKAVEVNVLLLVDDGKLLLGNPYLKEKLKLIAMETVKKPKIRVAKFHAKANYRRVTGIRPRKTKVVLSVKSGS